MFVVVSIALIVVAIAPLHVVVCVLLAVGVFLGNGEDTFMCNFDSFFDFLFQVKKFVGFTGCVSKRLFFASVR